MFCWIQIPLEEVERLQELDKVAKGSGFKYTDERTGKEMVEYHVYTCKEFMEKMNEKSEFSGNLSVRLDSEKLPLIVFGQDECIVKQYCFTQKGWKSRNGKQALISKDDGLGVMISAFVSHGFGLGMEITMEQLEQVNAK
jgi:hypothetical protein